MDRPATIGRSVCELEFPGVGQLARKSHKSKPTFAKATAGKQLVRFSRYGAAQEAALKEIGFKQTETWCWALPCEGRHRVIPLIYSRLGDFSAGGDVRATMWDGRPRPSSVGAETRSCQSEPIKIAGFRGRVLAFA